jgi:hypothetical protein
MVTHVVRLPFTPVVSAARDGAGDELAADRCGPAHAGPTEAGPTV